jgi:hypothetical protein
VSDERHVPLDQIQADKTNLYREETFTDLRIATIRMLVPVKSDGTPDPSRAPMFTGETQIMTQAGPIPVSSPIPANNLDEALDGFPKAMAEGVQQMMEEVREMQRREASRIVVPGKDTPRPKIELP